MGELEGKRVLVTGASSGIGAAIARELAGAGAVVGMCARRTELLEGVLADCRASSSGCRAWTIDLADLDGLDAFAARVEDELGGVDILVNNAGVIARGDVRTITGDDVDALMRINYSSPVRLTLALLPSMLERGSGQILTVSSVAARLCPPTESAYTATKTAITGFFEAAAADLWGTGVTIHLLFPGLITVNDEPPDELHRGIEAFPATDVAVAARRQLEDGTFDVYVPPSFRELYEGRARDVGAFVEASAAFARAQGAGGS